MEKEYIDLQAEATRDICRAVTRCRVCESADLKIFLDLGFTPPADQFRAKEEADLPEIYYPLQVKLCLNCGLSQLGHVVDPRVLYQHDYPYESSITKTGKMHWDDFADKVASRLKLNPASLVVDIGSNVGTLLKSFREKGSIVLGVDPAPNIADIANKDGIETVCAFFDQESAEKIISQKGHADVVTGTNVFAHVDDLFSLVKAVKILLKEDGVFVFESPHFGNLVKSLEYDTIYHEHLSYLSLKPLLPFFAKFDLEVFCVEESDIHGGSFRVYVSRPGAHVIDNSVEKLLAREMAEKFHDLNTLINFSTRVSEHRDKLVWMVEELLHQGKKIAAVSATAKGMTLLNYCGLTHRQISFVSEKSRLKIDRYTPGGRIPIVSDEELLREKPDYVVLLAWNFSKEIIANLKSFQDQGGRFIIPIPDPHII